jgi:hypothetical protein
MKGNKMNIEDKTSRWKAKSCPKCGGDIFLDIDEQSWFDHCLQCGYVRSRSGVLCPQCGQDMGNELEGYKCDYCGCTCPAPAMPIPTH